MNDSREPKSPLALQAREAIEAKLSALKLWIDTGIPWVRNDDGRCVCDANDELELDYFPKDVRAFAQWTREFQCSYTLTKHPIILRFRTFSRSTLDATHNQNLKAEILACLTQISNTAQRQLDRVRSRQAITDAQTDAEQKQQLIEVLEHEIWKYREQARLANEEREETQALYTRQKRYYEDALKKLHNQLSELHARRPNVVSFEKRTSSEASPSEEGDGN